MRELLAAGGAAKALAWLVEGMESPSPEQLGGRPTREEFVANLVRAGLDRAFAETTADQAAAAGQLADDAAPDSLAGVPEGRRSDAEHEALEIATAVAEARITTAELAAAPVDATLAGRYATDYPAALAAAGIAAVDLVERFPVLNVMYGYTRGGGGRRRDPARPVPAEPRRLPAPRRPLRDRGAPGPAGPPSGSRTGSSAAATTSARTTLPRGRRLPGSRSCPRPSSPRRATRRRRRPPARTCSRSCTATRTGSSGRPPCSRGSTGTPLSEYLMPANLGFFVYAAARGDFVLGGLQAVFETDLDQLLGQVAAAEWRCPLDPGCSRGAGACSACLHVGEPSCRAFNTYLDRRVLFGSDGFLTARTAAS